MAAGTRTPQMTQTLLAALARTRPLLRRVPN
jgi:hypothetical protein